MNVVVAWSFASLLGLAVLGVPIGLGGQVESRPGSAQPELRTIFNPLPALLLSEELRIGVASGDPAFELYDVTDLAVAPDGRIFVANNGTGTVRVFAPDGSFLREFGGKGDGPSETGGIEEIRLLGDRLLLHDRWGADRIIQFDTVGNHLESRFTRPDRSRALDVFAGLHGSGIYVRRTDARRREGQPRAGDVDSWAPSYLSVGPDGQETPIATGTTLRSVWISDRTGVRSPYRPHPDDAWTTDGTLWVTDGSDYRVDAYTADGTHVWRLTRLLDGVPVSEDLTEQLVDRVRSTLSEPLGPAERGALEALRTAAEFETPERIPPIWRILAGTDGALWVERTPPTDVVEFLYLRSHLPPSGSTPLPTYWDLYDDRGRPVGSVELPARFEPMDGTVTHVTGILKDEFDLERVVRYRIGSAK